MHDIIYIYTDCDNADYHDTFLWSFTGGEIYPDIMEWYESGISRPV